MRGEWTKVEGLALDKNRDTFIELGGNTRQIQTIKVNGIFVLVGELIFIWLHLLYKDYSEGINDAEKSAGDLKTKEEL